jgi:hypothetical protein
MRTKYYFGWFLAESSCIASGFGYSGKDKKGNIKWCVLSLPLASPCPCLCASVTILRSRDRAANAFPLAVEFAPNIRAITDNWNLGTATWLKHCTYSNHVACLSTSIPRRGATHSLTQLFRTPIIDIYLRFSDQRSMLPTIATYACSAFWHVRVDSFRAQALISHQPLLCWRLNTCCGDRGDVSSRASTPATTSSSSPPLS